MNPFISWGHKSSNRYKFGYALAYRFVFLSVRTKNKNKKMHKDEKKKAKTTEKKKKKMTKDIRNSIIRWDGASRFFVGSLSGFVPTYDLHQSSSSPPPLARSTSNWLSLEGAPYSRAYIRLKSSNF